MLKQFIKANKLYNNFKNVKKISQLSFYSTVPKKLDTDYIKNGPNLHSFLKPDPKLHEEIQEVKIPYVNSSKITGSERKVYFDIYGCQMNVNDTEIIWAILKEKGFLKTDILEEADIVLVITCAIREGAETKIWNKLEYLKGIKKKRLNLDKVHMKIGILGCMAERLKHKLVEKEKSVDLVAGPDSYKDLPRLLSLTENNQTAINVLLSLDETYADIMPIRLNQNSISAFVSIMRGCDNMCTYCIVPFTRGRERSRPVDSILEEIKHLSSQGVKEVTLLGQNVNSYRDTSTNLKNFDTKICLAKGFKTVYKPRDGGLNFAHLLDKVSQIDPEMRIRFTSPHPKDFPDEVLYLIRDRPNICKNIHLPAQSGNNYILEKMRRGYTRESYLDLVKHIRDIIPGITLSSDFICGFCDESEDNFQDTLSLIEIVKYNTAYLFPYSMRERTVAHRKFEDNVPKHEKHDRLMRMVQLYRNQVEKLNQSYIGKLQLVLIEGFSKRSKEFLVGKNDGNIKVILPNTTVSTFNNSIEECVPMTPGDYVVVQINSANSQCLKGIPLYLTTLSSYYSSWTQHN